MEKSKATIISYTGEPERICTAAARVSTTAGSVTEIFEKTGQSNDFTLIPKVLSMGHVTFIEHVNFTIAFENVSAFVEQFMIEFRLAAFTIKSRRYVDFSKMGYFVPDMQFDKEISEDRKNAVIEKYHQYIQHLFSDYASFVKDGVPKEDARFILPYCYRSNFYCSANARELMHIIFSAINGRGRKHQEIYKLGLSLLEQCKEIAPNIFNSLDSLEKGSDDKEIRLRKLNMNISSRNNNTQNIELISYTTNPENLVAATAIMNHTGCTFDSAKGILKKDKKIYKDVIGVIIEDKRNRELEQINFTFRINNLSFAGLTHLTRHRIQNLVVPSFVEAGSSEYHIIPKSLKDNEALYKKYEGIWGQHAEMLKCFEEAGVRKEDLAYLYLSGNVVNVTTTMNGRELFHFIKLRTCNRAQWEIREYAISMLLELRKVAPDIFMSAGPSCVLSGECPEGKLTCGKIKEVKRKFKEN
jgi:thymidylate synthase (FAD)